MATVLKTKITYKKGEITMKKLASILMTGLLLLAPMQSIHAATNYFVTLNGVKQNVTPIVQNGTTLLPVATVGKLVGYSATWNNKIKSGTLENPPIKVVFKLGSKSLTVYEKDTDYQIKMTEPVKVINGKTYLPLRAVGEALGMKVGYNGKTKEISLNSKSKSTKKPAQKSFNIDYNSLTLEQWDALTSEQRLAASDEIWAKFTTMRMEQKNKENEKIRKDKENQNKPEDNNTKPEQPSTPSKPEQSQDKTYSDEEIIQETLHLLNKERERLGLNKLEMRDDLNEFAQWKADYLVSKNMFTHRPDGKSVPEQAKDYGLKETYCGENLTGLITKKLDEPYQDWYNSPGHYKNMTKPEYTHIGIAISKNTMTYKNGQIYVATMILVKEK